ncbi:hypothetical protein [Actinoplanes solisilvae]|uniref:hypothetical protein n=1 Tax=Actinoplanes solisilvae TaxID=2486853 RepID=UPI001F0BCB2F|nr:hypothetical protein [Actinoplanes solisilvae]
MRILRLGGVLAAGAFLLVGCGIGPADGNGVARDAAAKAAERLNKELGHRERVRDAGTIAATEMPESDEQVRITPVAWKGRTSGDEKATIDVRVVAAVGNRDAATTEGDATICYRYTLQLYRYTEYEEIDCPKIGRPPVPSAAAVLKLPPDAAKRLETALFSATPETLGSKVRAAFPQEGIGVDTITSEGTLVAAVGVAAERDCVVMIKTTDGRTRQISYDRIWLEPGELGCRVTLYTSPPR